MIKPYFLSHAERGEPFQIQDFLGGIHLCRHEVPTPIRLQNAISISGGGGGIRTHGTLRHNSFQDYPHKPLEHPTIYDKILKNKII